MNAVSSSTPDFFQDNASESDSDSNAGDSPDYYIPISAVAEHDDDENTFSDHNSDDDQTHQNPNFHPLPNGYANCVENGVASLDLTDDEEEETEIITSESAIQRAFREDENRRNAPLPAENATRVMEAMRGISFAGIAPDWSGRVAEDMWIDHLRGIRRQAVSSSNSTAN